MPETDPPEAGADLEDSRNRRTWLLLGAAMILLVLPLLGVAYLHINDRTASGTPGAHVMKVFDRKQASSPVAAAPLLATPAIPKQDSLVKPMVETDLPASSTSSSLGFVTGGGEYQQTAPKPAPVIPPTDAGQAVGGPPAALGRIPAPPAAPPAPVPAPAADSKKSWAPPKLGSRQSGLKPASWSTEKGKAAPGKGNAAAPGGAPMDPAQMQQMMQMMGGGAAGTGGTAPGGMDPAAMMQMMQGMGGAGGTAPSLPPNMDPAAMQQMMQGQKPAQPPPGVELPPSTKKKTP